MAGITSLAYSHYTFYIHPYPIPLQLKKFLKWGINLIRKPKNANERVRPSVMTGTATQPCHTDPASHSLPARPRLCSDLRRRWSILCIPGHDLRVYDLIVKCGYVSIMLLNGIYGLFSFSFLVTAWFSWNNATLPEQCASSWQCWAQVQHWQCQLEGRTPARPLQAADRWLSLIHLNFQCKVFVSLYFLGIFRYLFILVYYYLTSDIFRDLCSRTSLYWKTTVKNELSVMRTKTVRKLPLHIKKHSVAC